MKQSDSKKKTDLTALRKKAEKKLREQTEKAKKLSARDVRDLAHELGTHQIELEMQNEELRRAQEELESSRSKYAELYDFAPVGYFTFDKNGLIREVNLTAANLLGIERRSLVNRPFSTFVGKDDRDLFRRHCPDVLEKRTKQTLELRLKRGDGTEFFALLESIAVEDHEGNSLSIRTAASDITERRMSEQALRESELRYRSLFENMLDGYAYCRMLYDERGCPADFVYLSVNSAFGRLTGLENVVGRKVTDIIPGIRESHPELLEIYGRVAATGRPEKFEIEFKPLDRWLSISVYSTERGHFTAVFDNITERKRVELRLQKGRREIELANRILRVFVEETGDDMYDKSLDIVLEGMQSRHGVFGYIDERGHLVCPSLTKMLDQCEIEGKCIHYPPEKWKGLWARALLEKQALYTNDPPWVPPGHPPIRNNLAVPILFQGSAIGLFNLANKGTGYTEEDRELMEAVAGSVAPVLYAWIQKEMRESERKRAEESLRIKDNAIATSINGIAFADLQGNLTYVNDAFLAIWGYEHCEEVLGRHATEFWQFPAEAQIIIETIRRGGNWRGERQAVRKDGTRFPVDVSASMVKDDRGAPLCMMASFSDITERKRAEEALRSTHAELKRRAYELDAVNRELEAFSYTVSHDLKAPLRSIEGFAKALLEDYADKLDDTGRDYLMRVNSAGLRMTQLIDALLTMARLTRGEIHENTVDLSSLAQVAAHELRKQGPQRQVEFIIANKLKAKGDATMLQLVLQNLLDNAWKFTSKHATAKIEFGAADMDGRTVFFVRDDGAGFDMEYAEKLFHPFKRLHAASEFPGLGIGLAIAHRIVMRHSGRIWAESEPGKGATFFFTL